MSYLQLARVVSSYTSFSSLSPLGEEECLEPLGPPESERVGRDELDETYELTPPPAPLRPWHDDRGWIAEIVAAEPGDPKLAALFWWVIAAGGWIEGWTAKLPALPSGLARIELHRMLRQHGVAVEEDAGP